MSIYLDNAATTQPLDEIKELFEQYASSMWYNPSARYAPAAKESAALDAARKSVAMLFSQNYNVLFTSSGTESANTVILGGVTRQKSMHYITDNAEHACVYEAMLKVSQNGGEVTFIDTDTHGQVSAEDVILAMREDTVLVSIMHVNNETGAVNDIENIARAVKAKNPKTLFHADGVQAYGRAFIKDFSCIDYYTVSAHKLHALKGTGAVLYKKGTPLKPFVVGGGQEYGLRSGTENTFGVYAFKVASEYFLKNKNSIAEHLAHLKDIFLNEIKKDSSIEIVSPENGASHIVSLSIKNVRGEVLLHALEDDKIYISTGSACSSKKGVSRTAKSLGLSKQQAEGIVRISFSPFNTEAEVLTAAEKIKEKIQMLSLFVRK